MYDLKVLINDFNLHNLFTVIRLFYGYFVIVAIVAAIIWLLKYFNKHEPTGLKITEMFDERGIKKAPLNLKPVFRAITIVFILIFIYIILLFIKF